MVGLLAGALGTGLGQAAGAAADMAKGYIDDERKVDLQRQFADIELEKQNRLDEAKKSREYEYKLKETDPNGQLVSNALKNSNLEARQAAQNTIDKVSTPGYLSAISKEDSAKATGEKELKAMRSGDSIASEGSGAVKLTQQQKLEFGAAQKEYDLYNNEIVKAQANNTWDPASPNAKTLLVQREKAKNKMNDILRPPEAKPDLSKIDNSDKGPNAPAPEKKRTNEEVQTDFKGWYAKPAGKSMWGEQQYTVFDSSGQSMSGDAFQKKYKMLPQTLTVRQHDIAKDYPGWTAKIDPTTAELTAVDPKGRFVRDFEEKNFISPQQLPRK